MIRDRMSHGFISGLIASAFQLAFNLTSYYVFHFAQLRLLDTASELIYGRLPLNAYESILAEIAVFFFGGFLGIGFTYLIQHVNSRYHLIKGWIYGLFVWFAIYSVIALFKMPDFRYPAPYTVTSNIISSSIFGLVLAETTKRLVSTKHPS